MYTYIHIFQNNTAHVEKGCQVKFRKQVFRGEAFAKHSIWALEEHHRQSRHFMWVACWRQDCATPQPLTSVDWEHAYLFHALPVQTSDSKKVLCGRHHFEGEHFRTSYNFVSKKTIHRSIPVVPHKAVAEVSE